MSAHVAGLLAALSGDRKMKGKAIDLHALDIAALKRLVSDKPAQILLQHLLQHNKKEPTANHCKPLLLLVSLGGRT